MNSWTLWMLVAAALALTTAMAAVMWGQHRSDTDKHSLRGVIRKRVTLFHALANRTTLESERPERRGYYEMRMSTRDYLKQGPPIHMANTNSNAVLV
jgi:hypothetical protein